MLSYAGVRMKRSLRPRRLSLPGRLLELGASRRGGPCGGTIKSPLPTGSGVWLSGGWSVPEALEGLDPRDAGSIGSIAVGLAWSTVIVEDA